MQGRHGNPLSIAFHMVDLSSDQARRWSSLIVNDKACGARARGRRQNAAQRDSELVRR
jgi:hypothetical protein